ncbi:hypothetical protein AC578_4574 [Pseudocercospora eumusae]|uniref:Arabinan endo-1,5-alpha-L-arabinosidase n=1 Tax=Pseudocercospora eumusae TaxID=321146 RepID=A0A139H4E1_9PEZI|nr:hypothetical protein AC578_4574 [Pseudocercospora eumusae]
MRYTFLSLALATFTTRADAYANPGPCSGVCTNAHDPSIIRRSDGTYFRFSTGGLVPIHSAPAITGPWTFKCNMLSANAKSTTSGNAGTDVWAPDVSLVGSTYYVYYSVSTFNTQESTIGLATSPSLDCGSFTDLGATGVMSSHGKPFNAIDANLFNDGGTYRLNFGSFWQNLFQVTMASPPTKASGSPVQLAYDPAGTHSQEASFMIKNGNYYYLFFSWGQCCGYDKNKPASGAEYRVKVCRSTSPSSGFVDASGASCLKGGGTTVLASHDNVYGPGGQSVYNDPVNGWVIVYHYVDTTIGYADGDKRFGWNKIIWSNGWPTV